MILWDRVFFASWIAFFVVRFLWRLVTSKLFQTRIKALFVVFIPEYDQRPLACELLSLELAAVYARHFALLAKIGETDFNSTTGMSCSMSGHKMDMKYTSTTK